MATLRRQVKNMVKNYSEAEVKVREATSNDPWGPSSTLMSEISDMTYNIVALGEVMRMIWKRLNDHGKNWRHVYKSLVLLDYLIKNGNEKVSQQCKEHIVAIQTLKDFQFMEEQKDHGSSVREKAKQLVTLLRDEERLKEERAKAFRARERYAQNAMGISSDNKMVFASGNPKTANRQSSSYADPYGGAGAPKLSTDLEAVRPSDPNEEDLQLKLAIMLSQQEHEEELQRKRADEAKLQIALEQSKSEGQPNGLVDLGDNGFNSSDPWNNSTKVNGNGATASAADDFFSSKNDPWSNGPSKTNGNHDPWKTNNATSPVGNNNSTNPWFDSTSSTSPSNNKNGVKSDTNFDPWSSPAANTVSNTNGVQKIDEFELFTTNRVAPPTQTPSGNNDPFDFFATENSKPSTNPWGGSNVSKSNTLDPFSPISPTITTTAAFSTTNDSTVINNQQKSTIPSSNSSNGIRKTPESFLGENSSLVNLENLIPTRPKSTNPFGSGINNGFGTNISNPTSTSLTKSSSIGQLNNPFLAQQQQAPKPTINQLQQQYMFPFGSNSSNPTPPPIIQPTSLIPQSTSISSQLAQPLIVPPPSMIATHNTGYGGSVTAANASLFPSLQPFAAALPQVQPTSNFNAFNQPTSAASNSAMNTNPFLMM